MSIEYPCVHWSDGRCKKFSDDKVTSWCVESPCDDQAPSNADRIRAMSDEELEDFLLTEEWMCDTHDSCSVCPLRGEKGCISILEWLKQLAEE